MSECYFYVLALVPDIKQERVKFGVARCVETRLRVHRTAAPTSQLVAFWPCNRRSEVSAMRAATVGCKGVGGEVYDVDSHANLISRLSEFFGCEPVAFDHAGVRRSRTQDDDSENFDAAMEILAGPPAVRTVAEAAGVLPDSVSRARISTPNRRGLRQSRQLRAAAVRIPAGFHARRSERKATVERHGERTLSSVQ